MAAATSLTPQQRILRARMAAHKRWSQQDPKQGTQPARDAQWQGYLDMVDPDRTLSKAERIRRAESARRETMTRLAYASSRARASAGRR